LKNERKFWLEVRKNTPEITWTRLENLALPGVPDLLGYNKNKHFFTVELKVSQSKKVAFSPHQIAFHVTHPDNTFILVKHLVSSHWKLFKGSRIRELAARGLSLEACCSGLDACRSLLYELGA
jgi:Holliday junction resolvase